MKTTTEEKRKVVRYIFRSTMRVNGVLLYAKDYGLKAFRIPLYR